jgi:hypothetical protein
MSFPALETTASALVLFSRSPGARHVTLGDPSQVLEICLGHHGRGHSRHLRRQWSRPLLTCISTEHNSQLSIRGLSAWLCGAAKAA